MDAVGRAERKVCFAHPAWPWRMRTAHRSLSACGVDHARVPPQVGAISPCAASGTRPQALSTEQVDYSSLLTCPSYTRVACQPDSTASASSSMPERAPGSSGAGLRRFVRRREEGGRAAAPHRRIHCAVLWQQELGAAADDTPNNKPRGKVFGSMKDVRARARARAGGGEAGAKQD